MIASRVRHSCRQSDILFTDCCPGYFHFGATNATTGIRIEAIVREEIAKLSTPVTSVFLSGIGGIHRNQLLRLLSLFGTPANVAIFGNLGTDPKQTLYGSKFSYPTVSKSSQVLLAFYLRDFKGLSLHPPASPDLLVAPTSSSDLLVSQLTPDGDQQGIPSLQPPRVSPFVGPTRCAETFWPTDAGGVRTAAASTPAVTPRPTSRREQGHPFTRTARRAYLSPPLLHASPARPTAPHARSARVWAPRPHDQPM